MRATTALAGVSFAFVLTGCGTQVEVDGQTLWCRDRHANINHASAHLEVRPETIELCRGYTLTLELHPPVANGSARTRQTGSGNDWLDRENTDGQIVVTPPADAGRGTVKYTVEVDGIGLLDPRIVVE